MFSNIEFKLYNLLISGPFYLETILSSRKIDPKLLEILVCPLTKGTLTYDEGAQELISIDAQLAYPIRDGIPIMLIDEARQLKDKV